MLFGRSFQKQREALALRLDEVIRACLSADRVPAVSAAAIEVFGKFSIGTHPQRREMRFFLGDLAAFTPRLVNRLSTLVAREFPKWAVVPQFDSCVFTVTANGVAFGDSVARGTVTEGTTGFKEWLAAAREYDSKQYGPLRRQLEHLCPRLPEAVRCAADRGWAAVAAFDFYSPQRWDGGPVVWVVLSPEVAEATVSPATRLRSSAVSASGFVFPEYSREWPWYSEEPPAATLATYEFEAANRNALTLLGTGKQPLGSLSIPQILPAADLEPNTRP